MLQQIRSWFQSRTSGTQPSRPTTEARSYVYDPIPVRDPALAVIFGGTTTTAGVAVNEELQLTVSAFYSGVRLICDVVAMMPLVIMRRDKTLGDFEDPKHPLWNTVTVQASKYMTSYQWKWMLPFDIILWGNSYSVIEGPFLQRLPPNQVTPRFDKDGIRYYEFTKKYEGEKNKIYTNEEILHIPGPGHTGLKAPKLIDFCRDSVAFTLATEKFGQAFFGNNSVPGAVLEHPENLPIEAKRRLEQEVEARLKSPSNARKVLLLDEGIQWKTVGVSPDEGQFLETRQFQLLDIARWLRIPPHMLYDMKAAAAWSLEQVSVEFLTFSIRPWAENITSTMNMQLLTEKEKAICYFYFKLDDVVPRDTTTKYANYATGRNNSWLTLNDILRAERRPLVKPEIGDIRIGPSTMKPIGDSDPTTPITPEMMNSVIDLLKACEGVELKVKQTIIMAAIPTASKEVVAAIIECANVKPDPEPNPKDDHTPLAKVATPNGDS